MGWLFRRSKSFGLFKLNFSKSGVGYSFGVPGVRMGVNAKGRKYVRGGIPGTGLYYQSSLPENVQPATESLDVISLLVLVLVIAVGCAIIFAKFSFTSTTTKAPVAPVSQVVAPVAAPVTPKHVAKQHKGTQAIHSRMTRLWRSQ
jgi:hypothetical protein